MTDIAVPRPSPIVQVDQESSPLHLAAVARVLGGEEPEPVEGSDRLTRYQFMSLTAALVFCEIVDGRDDAAYRTTHPAHLGAGWHIYVADRL